MVKKKSVLIKSDEIIDVICNKCKRSCIPKQQLRSWGVKKFSKNDVYGLNEAKFTGGFLSLNNGVIDDTTEYTFSLCERCLSRLIQSFKIPPTTKSYM